MKKLWISTILAGMMITGAKANTVTLDAFSGVYPGLGGGEFTAYTTENFLGHYDSKALYGGGFETFCVETGVEFSPGSTYYYTKGFVAQPIPPTGAGSAVPLSQGAAWLYYEFGKGLLTDFNYAIPSPGRRADDNLLQAAIWAFQGNQSYGGYPSGTTGNKFYTDAITALGASAAANYTGSSVEILQMWTGYNPGTDTYSGAAQNQLVLTGDQGFNRVPDGGMTVALLGLAMTGLGLINRKIRK